MTSSFSYTLKSTTVSEMRQLAKFRILLFVLSAVLFSAETSAFQSSLPVNFETSEERVFEKEQGILTRQDKLIAATEPITISETVRQTSNRDIIVNTGEFLRLTFSRNILYCTYLI